MVNGSAGLIKAVVRVGKHFNGNFGHEVDDAAEPGNLQETFCSFDAGGPEAKKPRSLRKTRLFTWILL